ncbi:hypothetical protein B0H11DRAFT_2053195 [Mycena galericulata]|nr:hypothetical protein B0H11DRAFT_2053195 [Mycena galericulata]
MHRALGIVEIVDQVCRHFGVDMWTIYHPATARGDASRALSVLARTSVVFQDSALNVLWRHQDSIVNLLKCTPDDLWNISESKGIYEATDLVIRLQRTIVYKDWERVLFYSHRVRSFSLHVRGSGQVSNFFDALNLSLPTDCVFPNLRELKWIPNPPVLFHHLRLFLTPRMERLSINPATDLDLSVLPIIPAKCPSLKHITIDTGLKDSATQAVSTFVRCLPSVESLDVSALDQPALLHVALMDGLKSFRLEFAETPFFSFPPSRSYFHDLRELFLPTMECATALMTASPDCLFEELTITDTWSRPTKIIAHAFYSILAKQRARSSLHRVRVDADDDHPTLLAANQTETYLVGGDILEPLFSCANLQTVSLNHPVGFDLDDGMILHMARAWPRIEVLVLQAGRSRHARCSATLRGLSAFAKHCPNLRNLEMIFDATNVPEIHAYDTEEQNVLGVQRTLFSIHVSLSPISEPRRVAEYLSTVFPHLSFVETFLEDLVGFHSQEEADIAVREPPVFESHTKWKEVEELLGE